uniref:Uncharacterized protein n=1 Tax=Physcomitrium patens TaxID=3218 RepID=A0A2K1IGU9_PHYPA|nr:hypothetical protein PHYPA_029090 [Physcomitrium patens]
MKTHPNDNPQNLCSFVDIQRRPPVKLTCMSTSKSFDSRTLATSLAATIMKFRCGRILSLHYPLQQNFYFCSCCLSPVHLLYVTCPRFMCANGRSIIGRKEMDSSKLDITGFIANWPRDVKVLSCITISIDNDSRLTQI